MTAAYRIPKWRDFQHYQDRRPPWIKLHRSLLDNRAFMQLPLAARALLPMLWLLAAESSDGTVPGLEDLRFRLHDTSISTDALKSLIASGFLEPLAECLQDASNPLAECLQPATPERENRDRVEAEGRVEGETAAVAAVEAPQRRKAEDPFAETLVALWNRLTRQRRRVLPQTTKRIRAARAAGYSDQAMLTAIVIACVGWKNGNGVPASIHPHDVIQTNGRSPRDGSPLDWLDSYLKRAHDLAMSPAIARVAHEYGLAVPLHDEGAWVEDLGERKSILDVVAKPAQQIALRVVS